MFGSWHALFIGMTMFYVNDLYVACTVMRFSCLSLPKDPFIAWFDSYSIV